MKTIHSFQLRLLLPLMIAVSVTALRAQVVVRDKIFGQNAWLIDVNNINNLNGYYSQMQDMGVKYCRVGGITANFVPLYSWNVGTYSVATTDFPKLKQVIDTLIYFKIKPIIQVGYNPKCNSGISTFSNVSRANQAYIAGKLVTALNAIYTGTNHIDYYVIANEPDDSFVGCSNVQDMGYAYNTNTVNIRHADTIAAYIRSFAAQMKGADSTIKLIGPELAGYGDDKGYAMNQIMDSLLSLTSRSCSVMGKVPGTNKFILDYISYHPYSSGFTSQANVIADPTFSTNSFKAYLTTTVSGRQGISNSLTTHSATGRNISNLKVACTEFNINLKNGLSEAGSNYNNRIIGYDNRSFIGGQWMLDVYSQAMEVSTTNTVTGNKESYVEFMAPWSVMEGDCNNGLGFISACSTQVGRKRPSYYHYQLLAKNFVDSSLFFRGTSNKDSVKTFGYARLPYGFKIFIINEDSTQDYNCQINTAGNTNTVAGYPLLLSYNFTTVPGIAITTNSTILTPGTGTLLPIKKASTAMIAFDCYGNVVYRKDYTMQMALQDQPPQIHQIGNQVVDASMISCSLPGGVGETFTSNTVFSNTTVPVTSDITLGTGVTLTFDNCLVVMAAGTKISAPSRNVININKSVILGCEGNTWKGISIVGSNAAESLTIDSSAIINADNPITAYKTPTVFINHSAIVNGNTGVNLETTRGFTITESLFAGLGCALKTSNASAGYQSKVDGCYTMDCDTSMHFDASAHDSLYITCNRLEFKNVGIYTENSTTLKDFGTTNTGAGNRFILTTSNIQENFLNHSGNAVTYYYDPQYATVFSGPVMNVSTSQATNDRSCPTILTETCQIWPEVGIQEKIKDAMASFNVYPNPSNGLFNLVSNNTSPDAELMIYDLMGRLVLYRKVNFAKEKTITFELRDKGLYFATVRSIIGQSTRKIIVE